MPTIRVVKDKNFTVMSNKHLMDTNLSLKARGLLSTMLSLPENWDYSIRGLETICKDGRDSIASALKELKEAGYLQLNQQHSDSGHFSGYDYVIYESPYTEKPYTEKPYTENPPQTNTKENKYLNNKPPIVPQGDKSEPEKQRRQKSLPRWEPQQFESFWRAYPRGEDRPGAVKIWDFLEPDAGTIRKINEALEICKASNDWQRGIGIPYAVRWLRRREWENEKLFLRAKSLMQPKQEADSWD